MLFLWAWQVNMFLLMTAVFNIASEEEYNKRNLNTQRERIDKLEYRVSNLGG